MNICELAVLKKLQINCKDKLFLHFFYRAFSLWADEMLTFAKK